jgi:hypothetical protein
MRRTTGRPFDRLRMSGLLALATLGAAGAAAAAETLSYRYDARGRLVKVERTGGPKSGAVTTYSYDKANNRTARNVTVPAVAGFSFEEPEVGSSFVYNPTVAGVTFEQTAAVAGNGSAWGFAAAPDGDQVGALRSDVGSVGATTHEVTGLVPGKTYTVRFMLARRPGYALNPVAVSVDGVGLGTFTPPSEGFTQFTAGPFTATGATASLRFSGSASSVDAASGIDLIAVSLAP